MTGYLLDTNVVSEVVRSVPNPRVRTFFTEQEDLWLSSIVVHELEYGVQRMAPGQRRSRLREDLSRLVEEYGDRILSLERRGAEWAAIFRVQAQRSGRALDMGDAFIAGTAKAHDLAIVTRNVTDFERLDVDVINPWEAP